MSGRERERDGARYQYPKAVEGLVCERESKTERERERERESEREIK